MATAEVPLAAVTEPVAAAPETPATPTPAAEPTIATPEAPKSDYDIIRQAVADKLPLDTDGSLLKPGATPKPVEAAPVAATKTPEELEAEKIAAGATETPEQKAAREQEAAKAAEVKPAEVDPLDKIGPLPAEKLAQVLNEKPELATALEAAGITKDVLFETARQAALTSQFTEIFATPDAAKFAQESAGHFYQIEESFPSIQSIDDLDKFVMETMLPLSVINDPKTGEPLKNPDGTFQTDGSVSRFLKLGTDYDMGMSGNLADQILEAANKLPEGDAKAAQVEYAQNLKAAIDYVQEFRNNGYRMPGPKAATAAELSPEQKAKIEQADRTLQEARTREAATRKEQTDLFDNQVLDDTMKATNTFISEALNNSSLDDKLKPVAAEEILVKIAAKLEADKTHERVSSSYRAKGLTPETRQKLAALNTNTVKTLYPKIVEEVVAKYGGVQIAASAARQQKIDTQIKTSNIHPNVSSSATAKGPVVLNDQQINDQVMKSAKEAGKEMDIGWQIQERLRLSGKLATA